MVFILTIREVLVNAMGRVEVRRRRPLEKNSCLHGGQSQPDYAKDVKRFREMKGVSISVEWYAGREGSPRYGKLTKVQLQFSKGATKGWLGGPTQ